MNLLYKFQEYIKKYNLIDSNDKILLAISGGIDSIVLMNMLKCLNIKFSLAHCNFNLRKQESDNEFLFIEKLAKNNNVNFYFKKFHTLNFAKANNLSIQMAARKLRYDWLAEIYLKHSYNKIATGHHLNDSFETIIFNITKGTGLKGLCGIQPISSFYYNKKYKIKLIRPMLFSSKDDIYEYAVNKSLKWKEDSSNISLVYKRNLIRNKVIPNLKLINPNLENTFLNTSKKINQINLFVLEQINFFKKKYLVKSDNTYRLDLSFLLNKPWNELVLFEIIKDFGFNQYQSKNIIKCCNSKGKTFFSKNNKIVVSNTEINIYKLKDNNFIYKEIKSIDNKFYFKDLKLLFQKIDKIPNIIKDEKVAMLDFEKIQFPLIIRKWKYGDYFQPLGMQHKKKISDFLIDKKISLHDKDNIYVITSKGKIVWLIGFRISERYKIDSTTKEVLKIQIKSDLF